jgi:hypothetical protein
MSVSSSVLLRSACLLGGFWWASAGLAQMPAAEPAPAMMEHQHHGMHLQEKALPAGSTAPVKALRDRIAVPVNAAEHEHVLADMQKMLRSMGEISGALAQRDWATVERTATALGPQQMMGSMEPAALSFHSHLPEGWMGFGAPMVQGFARIADEAHGAKRGDEVLRTLAEITQQCAGCHARFQLKQQP